MNEIQYCLKSAIVAACVPAFRRIKPYLAISPIFFFAISGLWHTQIIFFLSFTTTPAKPSCYTPIPFLYRFTLPSTATSTLSSHRLSFLPPQPRSFPFVFASFPAERAVGVFPSCPLSSPSSQHCQSTELTWDLGCACRGLEFQGGRPGQLGIQCPPPSNWNPSGWNCFNWEHWGPDNLLALFPALPLHRFQLQTLTPGGTSVKVTVLSSLASWHCPAPPQPVFCLSCSPLISLSQYLSFLRVSLIILHVFIWSDLTLHYKKKG